MAPAYSGTMLKAAVQTVWNLVRDFNGLPNCAPASVSSKIENGLDADVVGCVRSDKVSAVRVFCFGDSHLNEELLHFDDGHRSFSYRITKTTNPWINYVSALQLWPVTFNNTTFSVWTGDWQASPQDDLLLIPRTEQNVYQRAIAELEKNFFGKIKSKT
jgi:hypothetical protein